MPKANRVRMLMLVVAAFASLAASKASAQNGALPKIQFVPNDVSFWDNSENWTTNFGPAYRDTVESASEMLPCTGQYALCFHSGAAPMPCTLSADGQSANCKCSVASDVNYTLITAILNYNVYQKTLQACGADGSNCSDPNDAPVCKDLKNGRLISGANVISTFDPSSHGEIVEALEEGVSAVTECPKGPYAACMTAPCLLNPGGNTAQCKCPVFYGKYQLIGPGAQCNLGGRLVPSSSYSPGLDSDIIDSEPTVP
jgi:hypothetical protein